MTTELQKVESGEVARREPTFMEIVADAARDPKVDVAKMGELLALQERVQAREAEMEFNRAMTRLQPKLPRIKKDGSIDLGRGKPIKFAKWEDIDAAIRPIITGEGLSLSFTSKPTDKGVLMTCTVSHILGHSKSSEMQLPPDAGPGRNALQAIGSSRSYGKRYLTCDMLNIITEGADDDGNKTGTLTDDQARKVNDMMNACELDAASTKKFLEFAGAEAVEGIQKYRFDDVMQSLRKKLRLKQESGK